MRSETQAAIRAASIAQRIADSRDGAGRVTSKGGIDLVTATDLACEDAIRTELTKAFPGYPVIGEERGGEPTAGTAYWLVDPICGTRPFASNVPLYCTNIALVENGVVTIGVIGAGKTSEILFAEKGGGAWSHSPSGNRRASVADQSNTIWIDGKTDRFAAVAQRVLLRKQWYVWMFSSTLSYAYLASGRIAGILQFGWNPATPHGSVHTAAGCLVASEAGAVVTDLDNGKEWSLMTRSFVLAATRSLHDDLMTLDLTKPV